MTRLSIRKTTTRSKSQLPSRESFASLHRAAIKGKKKPAKKVAKKRTEVPNFEKRIKDFKNNLNAIVQKRKQAHGANDPLAKALKNIQNELSRHLQKAQVIDQDFAKTLNNLKNKIRNAPKSLKQQAPKLMKHIKENVRKNVSRFLVQTKKNLSPIAKDLSKIENHIRKQIKADMAKKIQFKVDPSIQIKINNAKRNLKNAAMKWEKVLNQLAAHGTAKIKNEAISLKNQLKEIQKALVSTQNRIKSKVKTGMKKAGFTSKKLITPAQIKSFEKKWNIVRKELEAAKKNVKDHFEQLIAVKKF